MVFVSLIIKNSFLIHGRALILDNAAVHVSSAIAVLEKLLRNQMVDGRPLTILILYLQT